MLGLIQTLYQRGELGGEHKSAHMVNLNKYISGQCVVYVSAPWVLSNICIADHQL